MGLVHGWGLVLRTKVGMGKKSGGMDGSRKIKVGKIQVRKKITGDSEIQYNRGKETGSRKVAIITNRMLLV